MKEKSSFAEGLVSILIFIAGYYIICKTSQYTLDDAKHILESSDFMNYIKAYGTPTTKTSYRISTSDIKNFKF